MSGNEVLANWTGNIPWSSGSSTQWFDPATLQYNIMCQQTSGIQGNSNATSLPVSNRKKLLLLTNP